MKRHIVTLNLFVAGCLILYASSLYPGGSLTDPQSVGFNWNKNFFSNLFEAKAINGADNPGRYWAVGGVMFLSIGFAIFFARFSKKIPVPPAASMIKYLGMGGMLFTFLIATPLHDIMVIAASSLFLMTLFYITVFILKSKRFLLKVASVASMLIIYFNLYLFGTGHWELLAIMQKLMLLCNVSLVLWLDYTTDATDFAHLKPVVQKREE